MSSHPAPIDTARLRLVASTIEHLRVELEAPGRLGDLLGAKVPAGWPPGFYDRDAMQFFLDSALQGGPETLGWHGWYAMAPVGVGDEICLVASAGYFGPPSTDGIVEIGYSVVLEQRGKGYATEIVEALVVRAFKDPRVRNVVAEVHESNAASLKVLERCGFVRIGPGRDEGHSRYEFRGRGADGLGVRPPI